MEQRLLREWQIKLRPILIAIKGVNELRVAGKCLVIELSDPTDSVKNSVMDAMERAFADMIPMKFKTVGKVRKIENAV
jgi:hypothetical protein